MAQQHFIASADVLKLQDEAAEQTLTVSLKLPLMNNNHQPSGDLTSWGSSKTAAGQPLKVRHQAPSSLFIYSLQQNLRSQRRAEIHEPSSSVHYLKSK